MGQIGADWAELSGWGVCAHLPIPMFDHVLLAMPGEYFEMSPCRLYLIRRVFYGRGFGVVLFL